MLEQKKKIFFSAYSLEIGGIETALVNLLNYLAKKNKYEITLVLEKKKGELLSTLDKSIKVIEYSPSYNKVFGKCINLCKRISFINKYKNKFDASFAYATYCKMAAFTAQIASKNCNLWVHSSYFNLLNNDKTKYIEFFNGVNFDKFNKIVFVSDRSKREFENIFNKSNTLVCNNIIDYNKIIEMSQECINEQKSDIFTFLYVGRITEDSKKVSRLIDIAKILKKSDCNFRILIIGNGKDFEKIKDLSEANKLNNNLFFLGEKANPYPYYKIADSLLLVSENEGYPVVYNEAKVLNLPIITTDVSDSKLDVDNKFGIVCSQDVNEIADVLKKVIKHEIDLNDKINESFNAKLYNESIDEKIENIIFERN